MKKLTILAVLSLSVSAVKAATANDSIDTYTNHTVADSVFVQGRSTLTVSNVNVTQSGRLRVSAPEVIVITGEFTVALGGTLNIYEDRISCVRMTYDASGNVTSRQEYTLLR